MTVTIFLSSILLLHIDHCYLVPIATAHCPKHPLDYVHPVVTCHQATPATTRRSERRSATLLAARCELRDRATTGPPLLRTLNCIELFEDWLQYHANTRNPPDNDDFDEFLIQVDPHGDMKSF